MSANPSSTSSLPPLFSTPVVVTVTIAESNEDKEEDEEEEEAPGDTVHDGRGDGDGDRVHHDSSLANDDLSNDEGSVSLMRGGVCEGRALCCDWARVSVTLASLAPLATDRALISSSSSR